MTVLTLFPDFEPTYSTRIYFGLSVDCTQIKIGLTSRPSGRRGGEMHFDELCCVPGDRTIERWYHDQYADERIGRTEWFCLSDRLLLDLYAMCIVQELRRSVAKLRRLIEQRLWRDAA